MNEDPVVAVITVTQTGEILRWSRDGVTTAAAHYEARVQSFGHVVYESSDTEGNVQTPTMTVKIRDEDRSFSTRVAEGEKLVGSRVDVTRVFSGDPIFSGMIAGFEPDADLNWTLQLRPRDARLRSTVTTAVRFTLQTFPKLDRKTVQDTIAPWVWGIFDGSGSSLEGGALPTFFVDSVLRRYAVCFGWVPVLRCYQGKKLLKPTTYAVQWQVIDGLRWTLIQFRSKQKAPPTVDVYGYGEDYDLRPNPLGQPINPFINKPGQALVSMAANLLLEDRTGKAFLDTHPDIDDAAFTAFDASVTPIVPYKVSIYLAEEMSGYTALAEWCKAVPAWLTWDNLGRLTVDKSFTAADAGPISSPWLREDHAEIHALKREFNPRDRFKKIRGRYGLAPADDKSGIAVTGNTGAIEGEKSIESKFAPAFV